MSLDFTLSATVKLFSFSNSVAFNDFVSGQKKMLTLEGESRKIQKKTLFHRFAIKLLLGLNAILSS